MEELILVPEVLNRDWVEEDYDWRISEVFYSPIDIHDKKAGYISQKTPLSWPIQTKYNSQMLCFGVPNATALFISLSHELFTSWKDNNPYINKGASFNTTDSSTVVFDALSFISGSIILAYTALEAFANENIPENFPYSEEKESKNIVRPWSKEDIEKKVELPKKLNDILPEIFKTKRIAETKLNMPFHKLKTLRDRIIHLKSHDRGPSTLDNPFPDNLWSELIDPELREPAKTAIDIVRHFYVGRRLPHWIKHCDIV